MDEKNKYVDKTWFAVWWQQAKNWLNSKFVDTEGAAAAAPVQSVNGKTGAVTIDVSPSVHPAKTLPANLGTATTGKSDDYARADHVHNMPKSQDIGAISAPQSPEDGTFLVYSDDEWTAQTPVIIQLNLWNGGEY